MSKITFSPATGERLMRAKNARTKFERSRFHDGLVITITGFAFKSRDDDDDDDGRVYPVLTTAVDGQPFDDIFLSSLIRPDEDVEGVEHPKTGAFNTLCIERYHDQSIITDEALLQRIISDTAGRLIVVRRAVFKGADGKVVKKLTYAGNEVPLHQLNFEFA